MTDDHYKLVWHRFACLMLALDQVAWLQGSLSMQARFHLLWAHHGGIGLPGQNFLRLAQWDAKVILPTFYLGFA
jgi:hypothetical protein